MTFQLRLQAQSHTQRAMNEGLSQDDVDRIDDFIQDLKKQRQQGLIEPSQSTM